MDMTEFRKRFPSLEEYSDDEVLTVVREEFDDPTELDLFWKGMKHSIPELWGGTKQFATRLGEKFLDPETVQQADIDAGKYSDNVYEFMGEDPERKVFDYFNPYNVGKGVGQMALPFTPKKATLIEKGWKGVKARGKFGGKVGLGYSAALPTSKSETAGDYWGKKVPAMALGATGGALGGELMNALIKGGAAGLSKIRTSGPKGVSIVMKLIRKIQNQEPLPDNINELGDSSGVRQISTELQERIQQILDRAREKGGSITSEEALKIAKYQDIGYPAGTKGAAKYPEEQMTPAQVTHDPKISQEEIMVQGSPEYKQKVANQARYMTGAVEKISEELQTPAGRVAGYTGSAGYPSSRETGEAVVSSTGQMRERISADVGKLYNEATKKYGSIKISPTKFMSEAESLKHEATAANVLRVVEGYKGMIRQKIAEQAPPYKGAPGTMEKDLFSSGYGKMKRGKPTPKAPASLEVAAYEGIRKQLTNQIDELGSAGKNEAASVLRKLRDAMDADVKAGVGHDVYKGARKLHETEMTAIEVPSIVKALRGKYDDDAEKIVKDITNSSPEQLTKLKARLMREASGPETWRKLSAQIWHNMVEKAVKEFSAEGYGKGRLISVATMESELAKFGRRGREIGAGSEKGLLLFGKEMADKINDVLLMSRNLEILGVGEVKTGYTSLLNLVDWGSKVLGKVPSITTKAAGGLASGVSKAMKQTKKDKYAQEVIDRTLGGPVFPGMRGQKVGPGFLSRYGQGSGARAGGVTGGRDRWDLNPKLKGMLAD